MKRLTMATLVLGLGGQLLGCDDGGGSNNNNMDGGTDGSVAFDCATVPDTVTVDENITADTTWCTGKTYLLATRIYVTNNAVLTVQPGTTVQGDTGSALVVTRGSRLEAVGSSSQPIVFTSAQPAGSRAPSNWGGVVLFGQANTNLGTNVLFEGLDSNDPNNYYGGTMDASSCGTLEYVRIEFAGQEFATDKEFNGLTLAGCGSATRVSYTQIHLGSDDGIEFFGGAPNVDHLVVTGCQDDGIDWDNGFSGRIQYAIVHNYGTGDKGIEADNNAGGTAATPRSNPTVYNLTLVGPGAAGSTQGAIHLRRATYFNIQNAVAVNWPAYGVNVQAPTTAAQSDYESRWPTDMKIEHTFFFMANVSPDKATPTVNMMGVETEGVFRDTTLVTDAARANSTSTDPQLTVGSNTAPNFVPANTALANQATPPAPFDTAGTFAGAVAPGTSTPWYAGWTSFVAN